MRKMVAVVPGAFQITNLALLTPFEPHLARQAKVDKDTRFRPEVIHKQGQQQEKRHDEVGPK